SNKSDWLWGLGLSFSNLWHDAKQEPFSPYTTLFRSLHQRLHGTAVEPARVHPAAEVQQVPVGPAGVALGGDRLAGAAAHALYRRSEEHTSELQSRENLVCRFLLEKKEKQERLTVYSM